MNTQTNTFLGERHRPQLTTRREMLARYACGFGALALEALELDPLFASDNTKLLGLGHAGHGPHHKVRAKNVIFLYMDGGPSQVDTFDPKPLLEKFDGKDPGDLFNVEPTQFNNNGSVPCQPMEIQSTRQIRYSCQRTVPPCGEMCRRVGRCKINDFRFS